MSRFVFSLLALAVPLAAHAAAPDFSDAVRTDAYQGFRRYHFNVDGCAAWVVEPTVPAKDNPWVWEMEFPGAFGARTGAMKMVGRGFFGVHIVVGNKYACPESMAHFDAFWKFLTARGLDPKCTPMGYSRGGLYAFRFAAAHPERVHAVYGDAPVCDIRSWPGGKGTGRGSPPDWKRLLGFYGFADEAAAMAWTGNPIDNLQPLADARIPLVLVVGDVDESVPASENALVVERRYRELGGTVHMFHKPDGGHHPHGLDDPAPVLDLICRYAGQADKAAGGAARASAAPLYEAWRAALESRVTELRAAAVMLGDEIVYSMTNAPYGQTIHPFSGGAAYDLDEVGALVEEPTREIAARMGDSRPLDQVAQYEFLNKLPLIRGRPYTVPYWSRTRGLQMRLCDLLRVGAFCLSDRMPAEIAARHPLASGFGALGNRGQLLVALPGTKSVIGVFANTENAGEVLATTEEILGPSLMAGSEPEALGGAFDLPGAPCGIRAVSLARDGELWRFTFETAHGVTALMTRENAWTLGRAFMELPRADSQKDREVSLRVRTLYRNRYRVDLRDMDAAATTTLLLGFSANGLAADLFTLPRADNPHLASVRGVARANPLVPHDPTTDSFGARHCVFELAPDARFARISEADLVRLADGRLLLAFGCMTGSTHDNAPCCLWKCLSSNGGKTWSDPAVMVRPPQGVANVMEVNFRRLKNGALSLVYIEKRRTGCMPVFRLSRDEGATWSAPVDMVPARAANRNYIIANGGHLAELKGGRLILPVASVSLFAVTVSDDGGKSWRLVPESPKDQYALAASPTGIAEPALVELKDGRLMVLVRTNLGAHYRAYSSDLGETWTPFEPSPLKAPSSTPNLTRLSDGRLVAVWNDLSGGEAVRTMFPWHHGWRKPLTLAFSDDEGESWHGRVNLETEGWCCMPFITEVGGDLFVGYGVGRCLDTLRVVRVGLDELSPRPSAQ